MKNPTPISVSLIVRRQKVNGVRFGIYRGGELLEGGFFSRWAAAAAAKGWRGSGEPIILWRD